MTLYLLEDEGSFFIPSPSAGTLNAEKIMKGIIKTLIITKDKKKHSRTFYSLHIHITWERNFCWVSVN